MELSRFRFGNIEPTDEFGKDLQESLLVFSDQLISILNGGLRLEENFDFAMKTVTTDATPGVETAIAHGLKRTPLGFIVYSKNKAAHIFNGTTAFTSTNIYVQSDVASVIAKLIIF